MGGNRQAWISSGGCQLRVAPATTAVRFSMACRAMRSNSSRSSGPKIHRTSNWTQAIIGIEGALGARFFRVGMASRRKRSRRASRFYVDVKTELSRAMRTIVVKLCGPVTGHVRFDFGPIAASGASRIDGAARVHDHAGHVHVEVEFHGANIDGLVGAGIAKLDDDFVFGKTEAALGIVEVYGEAVFAVRGERRPGRIGRQGRRARLRAWPEIIAANGGPGQNEPQHPRQPAATGSAVR